MGHMIEAEHLVKRYGSSASLAGRLLGNAGGEAVTAVDDVSFTVDRGEILGLIGPNGAGKTTTLKMLAGLLEPTRGTARVAGRPAHEADARVQVGYLPEESSVYEEMSPHAYLRFFGRLYDVDREVADERIRHVLDELDLTARDRPLGDMSKGMRRKVAIARSLIQDPGVLLYDEPASGLDPLATSTVLDFVRAKRDEDRAVVFSAHNLFHVERICDRVLILGNGRVAAHGPVHEVLAEAGGRTYVVVVDEPVLPGAERRNGAYEVEADSLEEADELRQRAEAEGARVLDVRTEGTTLEELFIRLARGGG